MFDRPDMQGNDEHPWDEQRWEAFIQRQEAEADEYMAMLEYYGDDPDSHNLIARSMDMGWPHLTTGCKAEPDMDECKLCPAERRQDCQFWQACEDDPSIRNDEASGMGTRGGQDDEDGPEDWQSDEDGNLPSAEQDEESLADSLAQAEWNIRYSQHPIHRQTRELLLGLYELCDRVNVENHRAQTPWNLLLHHSHRCAGKIAGSLRSYTEPDMLGMVIAYLKISYHAACVALGNVAPAAVEHPSVAAAAEDIVKRLVSIREQLAELLTDFRKQLNEVLNKGKML